MAVLLFATSAFAGCTGSDGPVLDAEDGGYTYVTNVPVGGTDYQTAVRAHLQPAWDMLGITAADIGTLQ